MLFDINKFIESEKFKKIFIIGLIITIILFSIFFIVLSVLGNKNRIGYLTDFNLNIEKTLNLNNLEYYIIEPFIIDSKLDEESIKNYLLTNENITDYVYQFRIRYYDKIFRNSDIYGVYPDLSNLPDYMSNAKMDEGGSPYGNFISDKKEINEDKIDNINYTLKVKYSIITIPILVLLIIFTLFKLKNNYIAIIALIFIPIFIYTVYILIGGVNIPIADDWELLMHYDIIKKSHLNIYELLHLLFSQHNEHIIFLPRIIAIPFLALTKWNVKLLMFLSFFIYLIGYLFIMKYFYKNTIKEDKSKLFLSIFITIVLFSLKQGGNTTWGFQIAWYIIFTSVVISFYFLDKYFKNRNINYIIISIIFGVISSFSSAHGLIVWLSIFSLFILSIISREKNYYKTFIAIILFGIACFIIYFYNYTNLSGGQHPKFFSGNIIKFFLHSVSSSIIYDKISIFSLALIFLTIYIIIYLTIKKKILENAFPLLMLIYSYGFIALVTMSRAYLGIENIYRYMTITNLLSISLFILYLNNFLYLAQVKNKYLILFRCVFIILSLIVFIDNINIFCNVKLVSNHKKNLQYILRNYKSKNTSSLRKIYPHGNRESLQARFYILEKYKFGVFSDSYDYLEDTKINE